MTDIADFLRARYLEARKREEGVRRMKCPGPFDGHDVELDSDGRVWIEREEYPAERYWELASEPGADAFTLADLDAKLAIIDEAFRHQAVIDGEWGCGHNAEAISAGLCPEQRPNDSRILRLLAQPFAGHPDHKGEEWAP